MILADSGYWLALANRRDRWHLRAVEVTGQLNDRLIVTWPVLTETCHLLLSRLGTRTQTLFLEQVSQCSDIFSLHSGHMAKLQLLMNQYADLPMDLADASLVLAAEEMGSGDILSTDQRDFHTYRWKNRKPFRNLLIVED